MFSLKFCGHVPRRALVFITGNMQLLCTFLLLFYRGYRTITQISHEMCSRHPEYLSNPNSHNEGNMNDPIIIPCCPNNSGTVDGIFFLSLFEGNAALSISTDLSWCFLFFSMLWSFTSRVSFSTRGLACGLLCKKHNLICNSFHSGLLPYTTTNKIFVGQ